VVGAATVTLHGRVDGEAMSVRWTMLSGPAEVRFANRSPQTSVTVSAPGRYVFQLTATDRHGQSHTARTDLTVRRYVALGDSYSSGDGAGPVADYLPGTYQPFGGCRRSRDAYPAVLDAALSAQASDTPASVTATNPLFTFGACAGARTGDLGAAQRPGVPPQETYLDGPAGSVGLVTLTLGGNDIGFADVADYCAALHVTTLLPSCQGHSAPATQAALAALTPALTRAYQTIARAGSLAPHARVLALGYPRLFPHHLTSPCPVSVLGNLGVRIQPTDTAWLNELVHALDAAIRTAAAAAGITYVDTEDVFTGHEFCNGQGNAVDVSPLGMPFAAAFHPTGPGQRALEAAVATAYQPAGG
jgi:hypothetical protein